MHQQAVGKKVEVDRAAVVKLFGSNERLRDAIRKGSRELAKLQNGVMLISFKECKADRKFAIEGLAPDLDSIIDRLRAAVESGEPVDDLLEN